MYDNSFPMYSTRPSNFETVAWPAESYTWKSGEYTVTATLTRRSEGLLDQLHLHVVRLMPHPAVPDVFLSTEGAFKLEINWQHAQYWAGVSELRRSGDGRPDDVQLYLRALLKMQYGAEELAMLKKTIENATQTKLEKGTF